MKNILIISLVILLYGCGSRHQAKLLADHLFQNIMNDSTDRIIKIYPEIFAKNVLQSFEKYTIKNIIKRHKDTLLVYASIQSSTNLGDDVSQDVILYMTRLKEPKYLYDYKYDEDNFNVEKYAYDSIMPNQFIVYDSKGLLKITKDLFYEYAQNTGCLTPKDTTDQAVFGKMVGAYQMYQNEADKILKEIRNNLYISQWSWEPSYYSDSASGGGVCKNKSNQIVISPRYKIIYYDRNNEIITTDEGTIADKLMPEEYRSFTFYTSYVPGAKRARIEVDFDENMAYMAVLAAPYDGTEYKLYKN